MKDELIHAMTSDLMISFIETWEVYEEDLPDSENIFEFEETVFQLYLCLMCMSYLKRYEKEYRVDAKWKLLNAMEKCMGELIE